MILSYETSSLSYDDIDLIHGKFIPATRISNPCEQCPDRICTHLQSHPIRIFCNVYGVFGDLTGRFAERYDDYIVPCRTECIVDSEIMRNTIPREAVIGIFEEEGFWSRVQPYPWKNLLMGEIYNLCAGEYFLLTSFYGSIQLSERVIWIWQNFGNVSRERSVIASSDSYGLLVKSRNDVLISADLLHLEKWCKAGGSGFFWSELVGTCKDPSPILFKRLKLLRHAINDLKELAK